jgi:hypothetical protein
LDDSRTLPKAPNALGQQSQQLVPDLRRIGIKVTFDTWDMPELGRFTSSETAIPWSALTAMTRRTRPRDWLLQRVGLRMLGVPVRHLGGLE